MLREHFSTVGPVSYLSIPTDRETGKQRGFAFVEFKDRAQADEAIRRFNNQSFQGRSLSVSEARARNDNQRAAEPTRPSLSRPTSTMAPEPADPPGGKPSRISALTSHPVAAAAKREASSKQSVVRRDRCVRWSGGSSLAKLTTTMTTMMIMTERR